MAVSTVNLLNTQPKFSVKEDTVTVIGKAITDSDYASKKDRARAALKQKNSINIDSLFAKFTKDTIVTYCMFYNATGDPIEFVQKKDWHGQVLGFYPIVVGNGQWACFVHTERPIVPDGSTGAVVYRIKNAEGEESDWMFAWDNPPKDNPFKNNPPKKETPKNHAYTEIREVGHFTEKVWPIIYVKLKNAGQHSSDTQNGCTATVTITDGPHARYSAVISLAN